MKKQFTYGDGRRHPVTRSGVKVHQIIYHEDGTVSIPSWDKSVDRQSLLAHARLRVRGDVAADFTDLEEEAARTLTPGNLVLFRRELQDVAKAGRRGRFADESVKVRKRAPKVERLAEVRELRAQGLIAPAIADTLGLSDQRVGKLIDELDSAA